MANPIKYLAHLHSNRLFEGVTESELKISVSSKDIISVTEGDIIYQTGDSAELIYLIVDGVVKIKFNSAIDGQRIFEKMKDDFFGEKEFIENAVRASSAVANTTCTLLVLKRKDINDLISRNRTILSNLQGIALTNTSHSPELLSSTLSPELDDLLKTSGDYDDPFRKTNDSFRITSEFAPQVNESSSTPIKQHESENETSGFGLAEFGDTAADEQLDETPSAFNFGDDQPFAFENEETPTQISPETEAPPAGGTEEEFSPNKFSFTFSEDIYEQARKLATEEESEFSHEVDLESTGAQEFTPDNLASDSESGFNISESTDAASGEDVTWDFSDDETQPQPETFNFESDSFEPEKTETPAEPVSFNWNHIENQSTETVSANTPEVPAWNFSEESESQTSGESDDDSFFKGFDDDSEETELSDQFTPEAPVASWKASDFAIGNIRSTHVTPPPGEHFTPNPNEVNTSPAPKPQEVQRKFTAEQLRMLIGAAEQINSNIKIDEVLKSIVQTASNLTGADRGTLYIVDPEAGEIWSKVIRGENIEEIRLKIGQGLSGWVAQTGDVVNVKDAHQDERFDPNMDKITGYITRSVLCFPIINKANEIVAVLQLLNSNKGFFDEIDQSFLSALSLLIAITLENAELVEQIVRTDRLSSLGKVANFIISDIKKPILTARQLSEHLKKKTNLDKDVRQVVNLMSDQIGMVSDLIVTVLNYSQGKTILNKKMFSAIKVLDEIVVLLGEFIGMRGVKVKKEYGTDTLINVDKKELYQAILQIVKNACDAMPGGGQLTIKSWIDTESGNFQVSFTDTGLGVPGSLQEKIFEPFMCHGKKQGVGLGLPIAEKIIKEHGGNISLESEVGEGATFIISLPSVKGV